MTTTEKHDLDFLGYRISAIRDEYGSIYVHLKAVCDIMGIDSSKGPSNLNSLPSKTLLTPEQVGRVLGIGGKTVNKLAKEGKIGCVEVTTSKRLFTKELVEEFIKKQTSRRDRT
jgi:excisionase family DNA binding protein